MDALGDGLAGGGGHEAGVVQGGEGEVDRGDSPAVGGEPEGLGAVAAAGVQGAAGGQGLGFGGQVVVWRAAGDFAGVVAEGLGPEGFPEGVVVGGLGHWVRPGGRGAVVCGGDSHEA